MKGCTSELAWRRLEIGAPHRIESLPAQWREVDEHEQVDAVLPITDSADDLSLYH